MLLAIGLAAARWGVVAQQDSGGLRDGFRLLTGGVRTAVRRQQTLRASVTGHMLCSPNLSECCSGGWPRSAAGSILEPRGLSPAPANRALPGARPADAAREYKSLVVAGNCRAQRDTACWRRFGSMPRRSWAIPVRRTLCGCGIAITAGGLAAVPNGAAAAFEQASGPGNPEIITGSAAFTFSCDADSAALGLARNRYPPAPAAVEWFDRLRSRFYHGRQRWRPKLCDVWVLQPAYGREPAIGIARGLDDPTCSPGAPRSRFCRSSHAGSVAPDR